MNGIQKRNAAEPLRIKEVLLIKLLVELDTLEGLCPSLPTRSSSH